MHMAVNSTRVAAIAIAATLLAAFPFGQDRLSARPLAATTRASAPPPPQQEAVARPRGRVYLFRGALGPIFSRGMDRLTDRLKQAGITADVYEFTICRLIAAQAIRDYRDDPAPVILIGHSMGGLCALTFAEIFQEQNIPVNLVVTVDPAHASPDVPLNVERYINIFLSDSVLGGGDVMARQGYQGHYASFDLSRQPDVTHINIDKMRSVHEQLVGAILQISATPAKPGSDAVPLRYVVPPDAPVELWDSGSTLPARAGDTLQTLAALHHVPLWSLTQINRVSSDAALSAGQPIIVPRRLIAAVGPARSAAGR